MGGTRLDLDLVLDRKNLDPHIVKKTLSHPLHMHCGGEKQGSKCQNRHAVSTPVLGR